MFNLKYKVFGGIIIWNTPEKETQDILDSLKMLLQIGAAAGSSCRYYFQFGGLIAAISIIASVLYYDDAV